MVCRQRPPGRTSISWIVVVKPLGPHHCTTCLGSAHASQTSSRGASKTRVITISRSEVFSTGLFLVSAMPLLLFFQITQVVVQAIEPLLPYHAVVFQPIGYILEGACLQPAGPPLR